MKAWTVKQPGGRDQLVQEERPVPTPGENEILIEVKAAGINRTDILTRENKGLSKPYPILGVEVSGVVKEAAASHPELKPGTRVTGLVNRGGYAEYVTMPADRAMVLPDAISFEEAAGISEVFLTAYQTLYWLGELKEKESVLIHAGGSGVGTAAIQLARQLSDAHIFTTAGKAEKLRTTKELGADVAINYKEEQFEERVLEATDGRGVDVILDFVGASYWEKNMKSAAIDARWVLIGTLGGTTVDQVSLLQLMQKRLSLKGTLLTPRSDAYKAELTQEFSEKAMPLFEDGRLKPIIHSVVPFDNLQEAHRQMEDNENTGKIILNVSDEMKRPGKG